MKHIVRAQYSFSTTYEFGGSESKERDKKDKIFHVLNLLGTWHEGIWEWTYKPEFSWPRHQFAVSDQLHSPGRFISGKEPLERSG
jgi:hypothetical protein